VPTVLSPEDLLRAFAPHGVYTTARSLRVDSRSFASRAVNRKPRSSCPDEAAPPDRPLPRSICDARRSVELLAALCLPDIVGRTRWKPRICRWSVENIGCSAMSAGAPGATPSWKNLDGEE